MTAAWFAVISLGALAALTLWLAERNTTRAYNRRSVRRFVHMTPWRSCREVHSVPCWRCWWRDLTGQTERAHAEHLARTRQFSKTITPEQRERASQIMRELRERRQP